MHEEVVLWKGMDMHDGVGKIGYAVRIRCESPNLETLEPSPEQQYCFVPLATPAGANRASSCVFNQALRSKEALWLSVTKENQPGLLSWNNPESVITSSIP